MPSYFGPINIPPIEAFYIGTPVIYSDLRGLREQVGDAALLCNLRDPESLAEHLTFLLNNKDKREGLIKKGKMQLKKLQKNNIINIVCNILDDYETKLKCWK
jgi:glycosyltransferase involved in cell wall biosynthesis